MDKMLIFKDKENKSIGFVVPIKTDDQSLEDLTNQFKKTDPRITESKLFEIDDAVLDLIKGLTASMQLAQTQLLAIDNAKLIGKSVKA